MIKMAYTSLITQQLGISLSLLIVLVVWEAVWKLIALWKSARKGSITWFIILAIFNTAGILPILYIFVFSKVKCKPAKKKIKRKRK